ncbi:MAG: restriction endonuclease subunit S [Desulforhopalus sp.]|nr:restriction endonuclease subunit S [Desulforhopalus sp.]
MSEGIPEGWLKTQLGSIIELKYGKSLPAKTRDGDGYPVYGSNGIVGAHSKPLVEKGGLIIGRKGSYGEVQLSEKPFFPIDTTYFVDELYGQPIKYWFYQVKSLPLTELNRSTAIPGLNRDDAYKQEVILPSLAEQKVIADKLDTLLAQVESTKSHLERIPEILKRFRQSVLAAAVSGNLTKKWREIYRPISVNYSVLAKEERRLKGIRETKHNKQKQIENEPFAIPSSWQWTRLGHIALKITDGAHNTPSVLPQGYPYLMAMDLTGGHLDFSAKRYISEKEHRELFLKCLPEVGDLLVVNIGAGTGNNVLIDVDFEFSFKNIAIIKKPSFVAAEYLKYFFDAQKQRIFNEQTRGGAQPFLSLTILNDIPFALPPTEEQAEIVRRIKELFSFTDCIEQKTKAALARVNSLAQSIPAKAFRGELTADWRAANPGLISGDNSAEALLAKIKAKRETLNKRPKPKRTGTIKKTGRNMSEQIIKVIEALKQAGEPLSGQQLLAAAGYPSDSSTDQLEQFFLDIRDALMLDKNIVKLERSDDGQDWFAVADAV